MYRQDEKASMADGTELSVSIPSRDQPEFLGQIIDIFEDFLDSKGSFGHKRVLDTELVLENVVNIHGADYDELTAKLRETFCNWGVFQTDERS